MPPPPPPGSGTSSLAICDHWPKDLPPLPAKNDDGTAHQHGWDHGWDRDASWWQHGRESAWSGDSRPPHTKGSFVGQKGGDRGQVSSASESEDEDNHPPKRQWQGGKGGYDNRSRGQTTQKKSRPESEWFCNVCNKDLRRQEKYEQHIREDHIPCGEPGCSFAGPDFVLEAHRLKHLAGADGKSIVESPEEIKAWRAARQRGFPSKENMDRKEVLQEKRRRLGALPEDEENRPSALEKLLRETHGLKGGRKGGKGNDGSWHSFGGKDKGKGKSKGKGKNKGEKGKGKSDKGKGKFDKGKGKLDKGKGKFEKGKGKSVKGHHSWGTGDYVRNSDGVEEWEVDDDKDATESRAHRLAALPSMLANHVPLEAPFGLRKRAPREPRGPRLCQYFQNGFCMHGEQCRFSHGEVGSSEIIDVSPAGSASWWAMPSTLANRASRPGEVPATPGGTGHGGSGRMRPARLSMPFPPEERVRRDGLFRRMLGREVDVYYSAALQAVRYVVATDFLRLDRVPHAGDPRGKCEDQDKQLPQLAICSIESSHGDVGKKTDLGEMAANEEELDDTDVAELAAVLAP